MAPAGNRDGSFEIGHWDEEELREIYLDGKLEGEWSCESESSFGASLRRVSLEAQLIIGIYVSPFAENDKECEKHRFVHRLLSPVRSNRVAYFRAAHFLFRSVLYSGKTKDLNERSNDYKYVLDLDGESWSKRFPKLMAASK